jgi:hypothetical protein
LLAGFDVSPPKVQALSGGVQVAIDDASWLDPFSPHDTAVLEILRSTPSREARVAIDLGRAVDARRERYLCLRAGQMYDGPGTEWSDDVQLRVRLCDAARCADAGAALLASPREMRRPTSQQFESVNMTKNGMHTVRVPIRQLASQIDLGHLVTIELGFGPGEATRFHVDDLMLTH